MSNFIKCKKCRKILIEDCLTVLITAHGVNVADDTDKCESGADETLLHIHEERLPSWISKYIEDMEWTKGKIFCPFCNTRIGAFDFTSGMKCTCEKAVMPAVHLVRSKVDYRLINSLT